FGKQESAGALIVSDARLLLLPVRSMTSAYCWVTCPHLIERALRDHRRAAAQPERLSGAAMKSVRAVARNTYLGADTGSLYLEERQFEHAGELPAGLVELVGALMPHDDTRGRLTGQLHVLHDDDFVWFARHGLAIAARNQLDKENKTSKNLWYEETLPP